MSLPCAQLSHLEMRGPDRPAVLRPEMRQCSGPALAAPVRCSAQAAGKGRRAGCSKRRRCRPAPSHRSVSLSSVVPSSHQGGEGYPEALQDRKRRRISPWKKSTVKMKASWKPRENQRVTQSRKRKGSPKRRRSRRWRGSQNARGSQVVRESRGLRGSQRESRRLCRESREMRALLKGRPSGRLRASPRPPRSARLKITCPGKPKGKLTGAPMIPPGTLLRTCMKGS